VRRRFLIAAVTLLAITVPPATASAAPTPDPAAGPLFFPSLLGLGPALDLPHYCSASVVHSAHHNLVLTAAHCVFGTGLGMEFAPGFHDGVAPLGAWSVQHIYVDGQWRASRDPQHDFAFLEMAPRNGRNIEDATGGNALAAAPAAGSAVTVTGYVAGSGGSPVTCTAPVYYTAGYPSFDCAGFADGVSGGPWVANGAVVGEIGGLQQGGCTPSTSYSPPFGADVANLLERAEAGGPADVAPLPGASGC
jgi:hypothetical protein